ncbi:DNA alkylation repair protein [Dietzia sp.]|uniref:DNA alkylation repair protein n=1 Tax=Dietzia sp. TaxID=1871616 RepID=UPI002FDA4582
MAVTETGPEQSAAAKDLLAELAALEDPKIRAVNEKHGDDHGVNLTKLRALAKNHAGDEALGRELWDSGDTAARLLALLVVKPGMFSADELDAMLRESRTPKVQDWLVNYIANKSKLAEELRLRWIDDADPAVSSAGWALTSERVAKKPAGLDFDALLVTIEAVMVDAPERLQWAMNQTLATIGIENPELRYRCIDIGERLGVLRDYPTPPNCTSPFAPVWITEIVRRREVAEK